MPDEKCIPEIVNAIRTTGQYLKDDPERNAGRLRKCVEVLGAIAPESNDGNLIFLSYLIDFFVDDVWCNIGVDSSYRDFIDDDDSIRILYRIGTLFLELGDSLEQKDYYRCHDICVRLVCSYLDDIADIDKRLDVHQ